MTSRPSGMASPPMLGLLLLALVSLVSCRAAPKDADSWVPDARPGRGLLADGYQYELTVGNGTGTEPGQFNGLFGILAVPGGIVYVCDAYNNRIQKLADNGTVLAVWGNGTRGSGPDEWSTPIDIALGPDGTTLAIVDLGNRRVKVTDLEGNTRFTFGSEGTAPGTFQSMAGIAVSATGYVVTDFLPSHRVQKFDLAGNFIWVSPADNAAAGTGDGQFQAPQGVAIGTNLLINGSVVQEAVYVADLGNCRVQILDGADGRFLAKFGSCGEEPGQFNSAQFIKLAPDGGVLVSDGSRIQRLSATGLPQYTFGSFKAATGISIAPSTPGVEMVYAADFRLNTIQKFRLTFPAPPPSPSPPSSPLPPSHPHRSPRPPHKPHPSPCARKCHGPHKECEPSEKDPRCCGRRRGQFEKSGGPKGPCHQCNELGAPCATTAQCCPTLVCRQQGGHAPEKACLKAH